MAKIPLPPITAKPNAEAHLFPVQVGMQTQEFLQGSLFYVAYLDIAAGELIRQEGGLAHLDKKVIAAGFDQSNVDKSLEIIQKYFGVFKSAVFMNVLISFCSHWDWYLRKITGFIRHAHPEVCSQPLSTQDNKHLGKPDSLAIHEQISMLERICDIAVGLSTEEIDILYEMSLVRNLGLHNRWEVDEKYLQKSKDQRFSLGHIREFSIEELQIWHRLMLKLIQNTTFSIAIKYKLASAYEI